VKYSDTPIRASDRMLHNPLFFHIKQSPLMGDVFVAMLAYRKFSPNCAWRAILWIAMPVVFVVVTMIAVGLVLSRPHP
jgi:hypothetical protein